MGNHVVDANVLLAASTADPKSRFSATDQLTVKELLVVLDWVRAFSNDPTRRLVLDSGFFILREYYRHLRGGDYGLIVLTDKLQSALYYPITADANGHGVLPPRLAAAIDDKEDRKFVAVALADPARPSIVNACDTDWTRYESALALYGITVLQLL